MAQQVLQHILHAAGFKGVGFCQGVVFCDGRIAGNDRGERLGRSSLLLPNYRLYLAPFKGLILPTLANACSVLLLLVWMDAAGNSKPII